MKALLALSALALAGSLSLFLPEVLTLRPAETREVEEVRVRMLAFHRFLDQAEGEVKAGRLGLWEAADHIIEFAEVNYPTYLRLVQEGRADGPSVRERVARSIIDRFRANGPPGGAGEGGDEALV